MIMMHKLWGVLLVSSCFLFGMSRADTDSCGPGMVGCSTQKTNPASPLLPRQSPQQTTSCTVPGSWMNGYGGAITINQSLTGSMKLPYCNSPHTLSVTMQGSTGFFVQAAWNGGTECQAATENLMFRSTCDTAFGAFTNSDGSVGYDLWVRTNTNISLSRQSLTAVQATGTPSGGTFSYTTSPTSGPIATVTLPNGASANPNSITLVSPTGNGAPTPGVLETITAKYTVNGDTASHPFNVATFGMSC